MSAIERLRAAHRRWASGADVASDQVAVLVPEALAEVDGVVADRDKLQNNLDCMNDARQCERDLRLAAEGERDRLAARVAELEGHRVSLAEPLGREPSASWQSLIGDAAVWKARAHRAEDELLRHWQALQPLTDLLGIGVEMGAWPNLIAALRSRFAELEARANGAESACIAWEERARAQPEDADPCPVNAETLERWAGGEECASIDAMRRHMTETGERAASVAAGERIEMRQQVAWLTRQVEAMRGRGL